jgi:hypothetical protein
MAFQVDLKFSPPYHPQSNGLIEKFMGTLRRMILTYINPQHINSNWDRQLRIFRFIYNTTHHSTTNNTPFFLVHGREARLPLVSGKIITPPTSSHSSFHDENAISAEQYIDIMNENLNAAFDIIYERHKSSSPTSQQNKYSENDKVLLFNSQLSNKQQNRHRKLLLDWLGPYIVTEITSPSTVSLKDLNSSKSWKNVHVHRIKPYVS